MRLDDRNIEFNDKAETVLGILRSTGIVPHSRAVSNGHLHKLLSASLATALALKETIYIPTRKLSTYHQFGFSTQYLKWLDKCVELKLVTSKSPMNIAEGELEVGGLIKNLVSTYSTEETA